MEFEGYDGSVPVGVAVELTDPPPSSILKSPFLLLSMFGEGSSLSEEKVGASALCR